MRTDNLVHVQVDGIDRMGSVAIGLGIDDAGRRVVFVGDGRMMATIGELLSRGALHVPASVPPWALIVTSEKEIER
jgi:hypothetical protein